MSNLIEKLTPQQEARIKPTLDKWRAIGLNTRAIDVEKAVLALTKLAEYKKWDPKPVKIWDAKSMEYIAACKANGVEIKKHLSIIVYDSPEAIKKEAKQKGIFDKIKNAAIDFSQKDAYWTSFYSYLCRELPTKHDGTTIDLVEDLVQNCGLFYTGETGFLLADRPCELHWNGQQQLHNPNGMAVKWKDGTGWYSIDGMRIDGYDWFFTTPRSEIDPVQILKIDNVDIRTRLMKTLGMEKFLEKLGYTTLDTNEAKGYKLISVTIGEGVSGLYLHMVNPSTGEIHVEGVEDGCRTVEDAMRSRTPKGLLDKYGFQMPLAST